MLSAASRRPACDPNPPPPTLAALGRIAFDLSRVNGVTKNCSQQRSRPRGHRTGVRASLRIDPVRYRLLPRLDVLERQRPEFPALELREDVELDEVAVLGHSGWLDV